MPEVTIIIPAYNSEETIKETVESAINQSFHNIEIVIVNDGSTDQTERIIQEIDDKRIRYYYQPNQGVSAARNLGISKSYGKYICFLDSDDFQKRDFVSRLLNKIRDEHADVCYSGYKIFDGLKEKRNFSSFSSEDCLLKYIQGKIKFHTTSIMIRKNLILDNNIFFTPKMSWGEDAEFFYKALSKAKKIAYCPEYLTVYNAADKTNKLSEFDLRLMDRDFEFITKVCESTEINKDKRIEKALLEDRLSPLLTYKLFHAVKNKTNSRDEILNYYNKYKKYINNYTWSNGLISVKLNIYKLLLKIRLKKQIKH